MLIVASTDGFCSVIKFRPDEIGTPYVEKASENDASETNHVEAMEDEDEDSVPVSKEGIPLNKEGVCSPADIKIRSVKEGGRPNPKRLQLITMSSPQAQNDSIDENDLSLVLEDTNIHEEPTTAKEETVQEKPPAKKTPELNLKKKRVPFITLSSAK